MVLVNCKTHFGINIRWSYVLCVYRYVIIWLRFWLLYNIHVKPICTFILHLKLQEHFCYSLHQFIRYKKWTVLLLGPWIFRWINLFLFGSVWLLPDWLVLGWLVLVWLSLSFKVWQKWKEKKIALESTNMAMTL